MRTIIVDDTEVNRLALLKLIDDYLPQLEVIGDAHSVETGVKIIRSLKPDLVILDIELGDGTGFDLLEKCSGVNFKFIFVTAFDHFAIQAFKVNAIDYLLKPVNIKELIKSVNRIRTKDELTVPDHHTSENRIVSISTRNGFEAVEIERIIRCEADGKYTNCILLDGTKVVSSKHLKAFEEQLPSTIFIRVHHSHLVSIEQIKSFDRFDLTICMKNGDIIPISQRKKKQFMEKMKLV